MVSRSASKIEFPARPGCLQDASTTNGNEMSPAKACRSNTLRRSDRFDFRSALLLASAAARRTVAVSVVLAILVVAGVAATPASGSGAAGAAGEASAGLARAGALGEPATPAQAKRTRCRKVRVKKRTRSGKVIRRNGRPVFVKRKKCRRPKPKAIPKTEPAPGTSPAPSPGLPQPCQEPGWRSDLCTEITTAMANRLFFDMADAVTFALLYQHYRTGQAIAPSIAAGVIEPIRNAWDPVRGQAGLSTYRVSGFLDFWVYSTYAGVDWPRFPDGLDTPEEFASWWQTYGIAQFTARQNAINHRLNGIVQSELAWRNAMDDWKAYDMRLITAQQYSDATVFAHRTFEDAQTAVLRAENAVKGSP